MKIFLAGSGGGRVPLSVKYGAPYILQTYYDVRNWPEDTTRTIVTTPEMFILDSGAFSFMNKGETIDWNNYLAEYIAFIKKWHIKYFFELDIDVIIGVEETEKLRVRLEKEVGQKCIPVFHACRGLERWRRMCEDYDFVAIAASGVTEESKWTKNDAALRALIQIAHKKGAKVHGLGYTKLANLNNTTVPFDSVDSTTHLAGSRYAAIFKFTGTQILRTDKRNQIKDSAALNERNIQEWVKMCRYKARDDKW